MLILGKSGRLICGIYFKVSLERTSEAKSLIEDGGYSMPHDLLAFLIMRQCALIFSSMPNVFLKWYPYIDSVTANGNILGRTKTVQNSSFQ